MENNWLWVADHDIEDLNSTQISVFGGRGLLIESIAGRIWLVGTAVEHHTLYQYQLLQTREIWMGQIQTETPYYQPNPPAPYPFIKRDVARGDPDFAFDCQGTGHGNGTSGNRTTLPGDPPCEMAWGLRILGSQDVVLFGAGLYSFFNNYNTSCSTFAAGENCQARILAISPTPADVGSGWNGTTGAGTSGTNNVVTYNLNTVGTVAMATREGVDVALWSDNYATFASTIVIFKY